MLEGVLFTVGSFEAIQHFHTTQFTVLLFSLSTL